MSILNLDIKENYPLKALSRIQIGGRAHYYLDVSNILELKKLIGFAKEKQLPFFILGNGSNILLRDDDFNGIVFKLKGELEFYKFNNNNNTLTAGAGAPLMDLGYQIAQRGYLDLLYMAVIPGTVGGAVRMNAGTRDEGEMKDHFLSALVLNTETIEVDDYLKTDMDFSYRRSAITDSKNIVIQATFQLPDRKEKIPHEGIEKVNALLSSREMKQPKNTKNFGSTFKRPKEGQPAGWYLDQVRMKGMRAGGAMVAKEHANWILNEHDARSSDVKKLIDIGQKRVFEEFGVQLEREVIYLPEDMEAWR